jgi:hypothetical protein
MGAHTLHGMYDSRELTENARARGPGKLAYWENKADPNGKLDPAERRKRAEHLQRAFYVGLARKSAKARRKRAAS